MANPSPQHNPTDGLGTAAQVRLSGTNITQVTGNEYTVAMSLSNAGSLHSTVAVTVAIQDAGGTTFTSGNSNAAVLISRNTDRATVSSTTITAVAAGQAMVDVYFPVFDSNESYLLGAIYATLIVTVQV